MLYKYVNKKFLQGSIKNKIPQQGLPPIRFHKRYIDGKCYKHNVHGQGALALGNSYIW